MSPRTAATVRLHQSIEWAERGSTGVDYFSRGGAVAADGPKRHSQRYWGNLLNEMREPPSIDVRFGHDLSEIQDENGVDLSLLKSNLALSVEERFRALEDFVRFAESIRRVHDAP